MWLLWIALFLLLSGLQCDQQFPDLIADIYNKAPPLIRAALINVGLSPRKEHLTLTSMKHLPAPPTPLSSPLTQSISNIRRISQSKSRYPHSSTPKISSRLSTRDPPQRTRHHFPLPQPPTIFSLRHEPSRLTPRRKSAVRQTSTHASTNSLSTASAAASSASTHFVGNFIGLKQHFVGCGEGKQWCDNDHYYPKSDVEKVAESCESLLKMMYVPIQEQDIARIENTNKTFNTNLKRFGQEYWKGSLCHTERRYVRPFYARDNNGHWQIILQTSKYQQRIPTEICKNEGSKCEKITACIAGSRCIQKHSYQFLISINPNEMNKCPSVHLYSFPTSCVCIMDQKPPVY